MAVNYANGLLSRVEGSFLCCTRKEGLLKENLTPGVGYLFLDKKSSLDLRAILKLRNFIRENKIELVHAHSTSFFIAGLVRLSGCAFKLVWHDHYGESELLEQRKFRILKLFSYFFDGIISVNTRLKKWALNNLNCKNVYEIKNFVQTTSGDKDQKVQLKGDAADFKIICVANLRPQKAHLDLLEAFDLLGEEYPVSLHLIGENPKTRYSETILKRISSSRTKDKIFYYGTQKAVTPLLAQAHLGILASRSEGLPLALLEYGLAGLPVLCTNVGQCAEVVGENGVIVEVNNPEALAEGILFYFRNKLAGKQDAKNFQKTVLENYSEDKIMDQILKFYTTLNPWK